MYVCFCKGIKDSQIRHAIKRGANTVEELQDTLSVGTQCGKCLSLVQDILDDTQEKQPTEGSQLYYGAA